MTSAPEVELQRGDPDRVVDTLLASAERNVEI
jgi:hypothetical protein